MVKIENRSKTRGLMLMPPKPMPKLELCEARKSYSERVALSFSVTIGLPNPRRDSVTTRPESATAISECHVNSRKQTDAISKHRNVKWPSKYLASIEPAS